MEGGGKCWQWDSVLTRVSSWPEGGRDMVWQAHSLARRILNKVRMSPQTWSTGVSGNLTSDMVTVSKSFTMVPASRDSGSSTRRNTEPTSGPTAQNIPAISTDPSSRVKVPLNLTRRSSPAPGGKISSKDRASDALRTEIAISGIGRGENCSVPESTGPPMRHTQGTISTRRHRGQPRRRVQHDHRK